MNAATKLSGRISEQFARIHFQAHQQKHHHHHSALNKAISMRVMVMQEFQVKRECSCFTLTFLSVNYSDQLTEVNIHICTKCATSNNQTILFGLSALFPRNRFPR